MEVLVQYFQSTSSVARLNPNLLIVSASLNATTPHSKAFVVVHPSNEFRRLLFPAFIVLITRSYIEYKASQYFRCTFATKHGVHVRQTKCGDWHANGVSSCRLGRLGSSRRCSKYRPNWQVGDGRQRRTNQMTNWPSLSCSHAVIIKRKFYQALYGNGWFIE